MTSFANSIIITHEIFHSGVDPRKGIHVLTASSVRNMTDYYSAKGAHASKEIDREPTAQDLKLEAQKSGSRVLDPMFDYYSRTGRHEKRNPELPMAPGEMSGECWDASGLADIAKVRDEIAGSGSSLLRTVVSVSREWADPLHLSTKDQWQGLIRSTWSEFVEALRIMRSGDERWCAFFHTDNPNNIHVHVLTWDRTGSSFTGGRMIPHRIIESSKDVIRIRAFAKVSLERSIRKNFAREAALERTRRILGCRPGAAASSRIARLARDAGEAVPDLSARSPIDIELIGRLEKRAAAAMPESSLGRASYLCSNPEARAAANLARVEIMRDPQMEFFSGIWREQVEKGADILGKHGKDRADYMRKESADLDRRITNAFLKKASELNVPWKRDRSIAAERDAVISACVRNLPDDPIRVAAQQIRAAGKIDRKTLAWGSLLAMEGLNAEKALEAYTAKIIDYAERRAEGTLRPEQEARLAERVRRDISAALRSHMKARSFSLAIQKEAGKGEWLTLSALFSASRRIEQSSQQTVLNPRDMAGVRGCIDAAKQALKGRKDPTGPALRAALIIMRAPEIRASVKRIASMDAHGADLGEAAAAIRRLKKEAIMEKVVEEAAREVAWDETEACYSKASTLSSIISVALRQEGSSAAESGPSPTVVRMGKHRRHTDDSLDRTSWR